MTMPPPNGRPDPPGRLDSGTAWFCEQCGTNRDQLGDEVLAPIRECPSCHQAACPDCWNIVASSCLRCVPFSLPIVEPPLPPAPGIVSAAAATVAPEPPAGKTVRIRRRLAKVVPTAPVGETAVPAMVMATPKPASTAAAPRDHAPATAEDPAKPTSRDRKPKRAAKAAAASAAAAAPEVQWPDRSVEWELRPNATAVDHPWPTHDEAASPEAPVARAGSATPPVHRRRVGRGRAASLVGFTVVVVAVFGVADLTLTAIGRPPDSGQTTGRPTAPVATEGSPVLDGAATPPVDAMPTGAAPTRVRSGSKDHDVAGDGTDEGTTPGGGGGPPLGDDTPMIELTPKPSPGATPAPTASPGPTSAPTATPTPVPTPEPTPTPTPEPTPTPTPESTD